MQEKQTVELTAQEAEEFRKFQQERQQKLEQQRAKDRRTEYNELVDREVNAAVTELINLSGDLRSAKNTVFGNFQAILDIKGELMNKKLTNKSHTFTNSDSTRRVTLGAYYIDGYRDTVDDGIEIVKEYIESLAKDDESKALVKAVLRLLSKDQKGTLKASRVLQLRKMAEESGNEKFLEGVQIIEESYLPTQSRTYIKAEYKDEKTGAWVNVPLGMTEA